MADSARSTPRLTYVHLKNWRNFVKAELELPRRSFLAGPAASGKTNFLDSLRFLHDLAAPGGGFQRAVEKRGGVARMRCLDARQHSDLGILVRIGNAAGSAEWEYELQFNHEDTARPLVKRERAARRGEDVFARPDDDDAADPYRLASTLLEQGHARRDLRELASFLASVRYFHPAPQCVREANSAGGAFDSFGRGLLEQIAATPDKSRKPRLRLILEALRAAVPHLKHLEVRRDARGRPHLRARYEHWRARGAWQTEDEFSDGTLRLIAILWAALDGSGPLLLEEPEQSLHAAIVRVIPSMLARVQRRSGRQIILTTHSLDLLAGGTLRLEEVFLFVPREEGTAVVPAIGRADLDSLLAEGAAGVPQAEPPPPSELQMGLFEEE